MPRVQENAPGILPSRSISRGSRMSTITTSSRCAALIASAALKVSISALASSISDLMPRWMFWGIVLISRFRHSGMTTSALPHQFLHRPLKPLDRDRVQALPRHPADDGGRFRIVAVLLRIRIEPHRVRIGPRDALEPDRSGLLIDMLDRPARHHDLVGRHRGIADEH